MRKRKRTVIATLRAAHQFDDDPLAPPVRARRDCRYMPIFGWEDLKHRPNQYWNPHINWKLKRKTQYKENS